MKQTIIYLLSLLLFSNIPLISQEWQVATQLDSNSNSNSWNLIKSYDSLNILAVGSDFNGIPRVIISSDAGKSWKYIFNTAIEEYFQDTTLKFYKPYAVHFDKDKILILAYDNSQKQSYFIKSFDSGKIWSLEKTNIGGNDVFFQGNNGIILAFDKIYYSSNNGGSWQEKPNNIKCTGAIEKIKFNSVNKFKILLVDQTNKKAWVYQTQDMATTWQIDTIPYYCRYKSFAFFDDNIGWVVGSYPNGTGDLHNDVVLKSTDSGKNWIKVLDSAIKDSVASSFGVFDIDVISKDEAIVVGGTLRALYTNDGGTTFRVLSQGLKIDAYASLFYAVKFIKPNVVIACGWDNFVARLELHPNTSDVGNENLKNSLFYPNPTTDFLILSEGLESFVQGSKIEIFSALGLKVLEIERREKIDVSGLPTGAYFVRTGNKAGKFIKQ